MPLLMSGQWSIKAQAATGCSGEVEPVRWNETVHRHAMVPNEVWFFDDEMFAPGDLGDGDEKEPPAEQTDSSSEGQGPEESWMYNPTWPLPALEPLTSGHYMSMEIGNDSVEPCVSIYQVITGQPFA